jgi:tetrahydromethanopterin S-methyltransferase subunit G
MRKSDVDGTSDMNGTSETDGESAEAEERHDAAEDRLDAADPKAAFLEALNVRRNGAIGAVTGLLFGIVVYVGFVALPATTTFPRTLYLPLIAVVAFGVAILVATGLTVITAWRRTRDLTEE